MSFNMFFLSNQHPQLISYYTSGQGVLYAVQHLNKNTKMAYSYTISFWIYFLLKKTPISHNTTTSNKSAKGWPGFILGRVGVVGPTHFHANGWKNDNNNNNNNTQLLSCHVSTDTVKTVGVESQAHDAILRPAMRGATHFHRWSMHTITHQNV